MNKNTLRNTILSGLAGVILSTIGGCRSTPTKDIFRDVVDLENGYSSVEHVKNSLEFEAHILLTEEYARCVGTENNPSVNNHREALLKVCRRVDGIIYNKSPDFFISWDELMQYNHAERKLKEE